MSRRAGGSLIATVVLAACGAAPIEGSGGALDSDSASSTTAASGSASTTTGGDASSASAASGMSSGEGSTGVTGSGSSGSSGSSGDLSSTSTSTSSGTNPSSSGVDPSDGTSTGSTSGDPTFDLGDACQELITLELDAADVTELDGGWYVGFSPTVLKDVVWYEGDGAQSNGAVWQPEIPCTSEWYVWVRLRDAGEEDSFFVRVDGEPLGWVVFDGDCSGASGPWRWTALNWREPQALPCQFTQDPWVLHWESGSHELRFRFRDSRGIADIVVTNDAEFTP